MSKFTKTDLEVIHALIGNLQHYWEQDKSSAEVNTIMCVLIEQGHELEAKIEEEVK